MSRTSRIGVCFIVLVATVFAFLSKHSGEIVVEVPSFKIEPCEQCQYVLPHMSYEELIITMNPLRSCLCIG